MTAPAPLYDLTLLLDPQSEESTRTKVLEDTRSAIAARGELVRDDDWGERALSYPIKRRKTAEYHLLQFHVGDKALLSGLERTLHITDGVLRFRVVKLKPGTGTPPDMRSSSSAPRRAESAGQHGEDEERASRRHGGEQAGGPAEPPPDASTEEAAQTEAGGEAQASAEPEQTQASAEPEQTQASTEPEQTQASTEPEQAGEQ